MKRREKMSGRGGSGGSGGGGGRAKSMSPVFNRPPWLLYNIAEMDERMQMLKLNTRDEENASNFAGRAEGYYQKRPQLLALLHDLYNGYVSLADRYCQALAKNQQHHRRCPSPISPFNFYENNEEAADSDAESSSLSYQTPCPPVLDADIVVADLVMKSVNYEIVLNELNVADKRQIDSSRKTELQKSLIDVLESERIIMLNENASLAFRVNALLEENNGLVSESVYMKKKAGELARYAAQSREEDHRVCVLSEKIKDLQEQVNGLEKQNKEYYDRIVEHEVERIKSEPEHEVERIKSEPVIKKTGSRIVIDGVSCFGNDSNGVQVRTGNGGRGVIKPSRAGKRGLKIWDRLKKLKIFMCVP